MGRDNPRPAALASNSGPETGAAIGTIGKDAMLLIISQQDYLNPQPKGVVIPFFTRSVSASEATWAL